MEKRKIQNSLATWLEIEDILLEIYGESRLIFITNKFVYKFYVSIKF